MRSKVASTSPCGKHVYTTKKLAKQVAAQVRREHGENVHAYHCVDPCHGWHIGHPKGAPRRVEEATA